MVVWNEVLKLPNFVYNRYCADTGAKRNTNIYGFSTVYGLHEAKKHEI